MQFRHLHLVIHDSLTFHEPQTQNLLVPQIIPPQGQHALDTSRTSHLALIGFYI